MLTVKNLLVNVFIVSLYSYKDRCSGLFLLPVTWSNQQFSDGLERGEVTLDEHMTEDIQDLQHS